MKKKAKAMIMLGVASSICVVGLNADKKSSASQMQQVIGIIDSVDTRKDVVLIDTSRLAVLKRKSFNPQLSVTGLIQKSSANNCVTEPHKGDLLVTTIDPNDGNKKIVDIFTIFTFDLN